jgi:hypothetical protein
VRVLITWPELCEALQRRHNHQVRCTGGIPPADRVKVALPQYETSGTPSIPYECETILDKRFLEIIQRMFEEAYIPGVWETAEVVPFLEKDPATDTNIYRAMRIIPSTIKLMCVIRTYRIQAGLEERCFFVP